MRKNIVVALAILLISITVFTYSKYQTQKQEKKYHVEKVNTAIDALYSQLNSEFSEKFITACISNALEKAPNINFKPFCECASREIIQEISNKKSDFSKAILDQSIETEDHTILKTIFDKYYDKAQLTNISIKRCANQLPIKTD